jgi:hypothetical protein
MDPLTILALTLAGAALLGLVFFSGYETASRQLAGRYQHQADLRVRGLLDDLAKRKRVTNTPKRRARK